jgi:hypothetical protein
MTNKSIAVTPASYPLPLTSLIYGITGLTFLRHKSELSRVARDLVYTGVKTLASRHPKYFPKLYFTQRGSLSHSKEVEDAIYRLAGVLEVQNPSYQYLGFCESELDHVETKLNEWFSPQTKKIVENLAQEFYQLITKKSTAYA